MNLNTNLKALVANQNGPQRPVVVLEGGTRSGKTWSVLEYFLMRMLQEPGREIRVVREKQAVCRRTIVVDFKKIAKKMGIWDEECWNKTDAQYTMPNGAWIQFDGCDDPGKLHGMSQDDLFINEAMEVGLDSWTQLAYRTRGLKVVDFNPSLSVHWVFTHLLTRSSDEVMHVVTTFEDNPHLTKSQVDEILAYKPTPENIARGTADPYKWDVYGLGRRGRREGRVFEFFTIVYENWPRPEVCQRWGYGLDFGFSLDPTVLLNCCVHQDDLWLREIFRETGLVTNKIPQNPTQPSIEQRLEEHGISPSSRIWTDQDPGIVQGLRAAGFSVMQAEKGPGSILHGIDLMKQRPIRLWHQSQELIQEFEQYTWKRTVAGKWLQEPEDKFNHGPDAGRYWTRMEVQPRMRMNRQGNSRSRKAKTVLRRW